MEEPSSNSAKGRTSFDANVAGSLVNFFNKNSTPYPTELGSQKFELVPVTKQKDQMINVARLYAQQEYDRIMEMVSVLQKQAENIKRRLEITDLVHTAEYQFKLYHGKCYWLVLDSELNKTLLVMNGPTGWFCGKPEKYQYIACVKWLGDYTWIEVDIHGNPL